METRYIETYARVAALALAVLPTSFLHGAAPDSDPQNRVVTVQYTSRSGASSRTTEALFDGLGRPSGRVRPGASPTRTGDTAWDIRTWVEYDACGRPVREWLPYSRNPQEGTAALPAAAGSEDYGTGEEPWTVTEYDGSPLARVRTEYGAGRAWHEGGKAVRRRDLVNGTSGALRCVRYTASWASDTSVVLTSAGAWAAGTLAVSETSDEDGGTSYTFTDPYGQTVLTRRVLPGADDSDAEHLDTYYLYDGMGRLAAVLPPTLSASLSASPWTTWTDPGLADIGRYAYLYRYDGRGNCIAKRLPGCGWMFAAYDAGGRAVLTQDVEQRRTGEWTFTASDGQGRPCLTGTCRDTLDVFAGPLSDRPVQAVWTGETSGTVYGYTVSGYAPKSLEVLQVQWWDGYGFAGHWGVPALTDDRVRRTAGPGEGGLWEMSPESAPDSLYAGAQGLPTGSLSKVLGPLSGNQYLWGVRYHDGRGREVQSVRQTLRGVEKEETAYGFTDEVLRRTLTHTGADGNTVMTERYTYTYDGWGRPLTVVHTVDGAAPVTLHAYTYDGVGRQTGDARNGVSALGTSCSYNVRSWTTSLETGASGSTFSERLSYCGAEGTGTVPSHPRWGGDVGAQSWRAGRDGMIRRYDYAYDGAGRLVEAAYTATSGGSRYDRGYAYDRNGNVTQVTGLSAGSYAAGGISTVSSLWYDGNRLTSEMNAATLLAEPVLLDAAPATAAQSASAPEPAAFPVDVGAGTPVIDDVLLGSSVTKVYDRVGRLVRDEDTHLSKVSYNHLGLPSRVTFLPSGGVTPDPLGLQYTADGRKLRAGRLVSATRPARPQGVSTQSSWAVGEVIIMERFDAPTDYSGNLVYKSGVLDKVLFDGGYISAADTSYHFFITDHQGNVRVVADASGAVEQVTHYGPFGEDLGDSAASLPVGAQNSVGNPYKYGGKEWDSALGLYDFSARLYRPAIARFTTMDPLCENHFNVSPYAYCNNNPLTLIDPDGLESYHYDYDSQEYFDEWGYPVPWSVVLFYIQNKAIEDWLSHTDEILADTKTSPLDASLALTGEFIKGIGPEHRTFDQSFRITQSLKNSEMTKIALRRYWNDVKKGEVKPNYPIDWGPIGLFYSTGVVKELWADGGFSTPQFTGTATYFFEDAGANISVKVKDNKTVRSLFYHLTPNQHTREESPAMGRTGQTYLFSVSKVEVMLMMSEK